MIFKSQCITTNIYDDHNIKFEIYSFIQIVATIFSLKLYQTDEICSIFQSTWKYRTALYNRIKYENVVLGICEYILRNDENFNVSIIIPMLYPKKTQNYNSMQIYSVVQMLPDILND